MGYIFEAEIDAIMTAVRARTIGEEDGITLRKLQNADIHPAIKAYFRAEVERTLVHERANEQRSRRFAYGLPEVVSLQQQIDRLLILNYHFDQTEFEGLLDQSVHFEFNYLCRPQFTLLSFIMGSQRRVSTVEIDKRLQYCVDYKYFPELIRRYFNDRGLVEVSYEEFKSLLERIDQEIVSKHSAIELARMLRALSEFVDESRLQPRDAEGNPMLPTNAAIVFFEDKQLTPVKVRLEFERDINELNVVSLQQLAELVDLVRGVEEGVVPVAPLEQEGEGVATDVPDVDPESVAAPKPTSVPEPGSVQPPVEESVIDAAEASSIPPVEELFPSMSEPPASDSSSALEHDQPAVIPAGLRDVHEIFTDAEQKKFIKTIFRKDERAFRTTLDELNILPTWQETSLFLDSLFISLNVDPFSEPAVHFTDRLYVRFYPDDSVEPTDS